VSIIKLVLNFRAQFRGCEKCENSSLYLRIDDNFGINTTIGHDLFLFFTLLSTSGNGVNNKIGKRNRITHTPFGENLSRYAIGRGPGQGNHTG